MTAEHVTDHDSTEYDRRGALRAGALIGIGGAAVGAVAACGSGAGAGDSGGSNGSGGAKQAP
ncbi:MAG: hypothetical protein J2O49_04645, partial [Sciscionella sp.]|nr:hypothetical protein [Sciscionella sp.]